MNFEEFDEFGGASRVFFLDTNLSSPVLITEIQSMRGLILNAVESNNRTHYHSLDWKVKNSVTFFRKLCKLNLWTKQNLLSARSIDPTEYPMMERWMLENMNRYDSAYTTGQKAAQDIEDALCSGLRSRGLPDNEVRGTASVLSCREAEAFRRAYEEISDLFGRAESRVKASEFSWTKGSVGSLTIWINAHHAMVSHSDTLWYSSLNQILMLKDKLATRYQLLEHVLPLGLDGSLLNHLTELFAWQDETLKLYGNQAYNILKAVEPMFKTRLSHVVDNIFGSDTAYTRMIQKMAQKESAVRSRTGVFGQDQMRKLQELVEKVNGTRNIVEMFGCLKSCGHPIIDPCLGGFSAAEEARSADETKLTDAQQLRNTFCHTVLVSFVKKHGHWPRLTYNKRGTELQRLNDRQERNLDYNSYPFDDWNTTEWTKIFEFDYFPNFLELMDDKSISLYKSQKHASWDFDVKVTSQRRLLLELLGRKHIVIEEIIKRVSRRDIPRDWFIVSLYPKEREFKIEPRMFAMLVLEMRCFFTAIESNIADQLFRYLPQQTMTKTKTQNQERFLAFTDPAKNISDYILFLEIDLTRWNLRWRELVIHMLGHDLNMMFGMPGTFTVTHWFFKRCQIMVRVAGLRPDGIELDEPPISSLAWRDHLGGFEGLNQKLWTAATYAMVETALIPLLRAGKISSYELVGQGDNQVVRLSIPSQGRTREDIIPEIRDLTNDALEEACRKVNQIVKPDENIESTSVLTYSKDVFVQGVEYPTSLKKHSRLFPVTSMDFPSVTSNARAILSDAVAGGENSMHPLRSALIGCYHASRYLLSASRGFSIHGKAFPRLTISEVIAAITLPSSIGGLAGMNFASFFYKGGSDPLGKEISGMRLLASGTAESSRLCSSALRALEDKYGISEDPDLTILIDNPYALPLAKASSPLSKVGRLSLDAFRPRVTNKEIRPLLEKDVVKEEDILKNDLLSMEPLNPILVHDIFDASGFGTVKLMRKMFIHTRTIQTIAQLANPNITHIFLTSDMNELIGFKTWLKGLPDCGYSGRTSFELTTSFRRYWGRELQGVNSHQPLDCIHISNSTRAPSSIKWSAHSHSDLLNTRGPLSGYVGTATREKRSEHGYKIVDTGAPSRSVMKLQLIRSQAYGNANFNLLLDNVALTRSPVKLSDVTNYLPKVIGGSIIHRFSSVIRSMSASYVGPLNFVTHIRVNTDSIGVISGSALNYPIMLQEHIVMAQAGAKLLYMHTKCHSGEMIINSDSYAPLPDSGLSCQPPKFSHTSLPKSVLLYSPGLSLTRTYDNVMGAIPRYAVVSPTDYVKPDRIFDSFVGFFMNTLRDQNRAKQIADTRGHAAIPSKYQIDIAEAHAVGPFKLIRSIAYAVVLTTVRDTFRTLQLHPERWDEAMFMVHNINVCLKACAGYWNHPLFQTHQDYSRLRSSELKYMSTGGRFTRLEAHVRRNISLLMISPEHRFWKYSVPVFAGENSTRVSEALTIAGARAIVQTRLSQDPMFPLFASFFSGYMRLPKGITLASENILDLLRLKFEGLARIIQKQGAYLLAHELHRVGGLRRISVYNDDVRTVMRNSRSLRPDLRLPVIKEKKQSIAGFLSALDHCPLCLPQPRSIHSCMWDRYKQRRRGGMSSAGYTWLPLITQLKVTEKVLIIGNGHGGLADLLITCFGVDVVGLDLEVDMPRDAATLLNYIPIGLSLDNRSRFIQSDWSINSSGDWTSSDVRALVLESLPGLSTVFIDAIGPSSGELIDSCLSTLESRLVSNVYLRLIGTSDEITIGIRAIRERYESRWWVVSRSTVSMEVILEVERARLPTHRCTNSPMLIDLDITDYMHSVIPEARGELLEAATNSCISWNGETLAEAYLVMRNLCKSLLNKDRSQQLVYRQRYDLIVAYATLYALQQDRPLVILQDWISEEQIETDLFTLATRESTISHLIRYVSRLSSFTDNSILFFS